MNDLYDDETIINDEAVVFSLKFEKPKPNSEIFSQNRNEISFQSQTSNNKNKEPKRQAPIAPNASFNLQNDIEKAVAKPTETRTSLARPTVPPPPIPSKVTITQQTLKDQILPPPPPPPPPIPSKVNITQNQKTVKNHIPPPPPPPPPKNLLTPTDTKVTADIKKNNNTYKPTTDQQIQMMDDLKRAISERGKFTRSSSEETGEAFNKISTEIAQEKIPQPPAKAFKLPITPSISSPHKPNTNGDLLDSIRNFNSKNLKKISPAEPSIQQNCSQLEKSLNKILSRRSNN